MKPSIVYDGRNGTNKNKWITKKQKTHYYSRTTGVLCVVSFHFRLLLVIMLYFILFFRIVIASLRLKVTFGIYQYQMKRTQNAHALLLANERWMKIKTIWCSTEPHLRARCCCRFRCKIQTIVFFRHKFVMCFVVVDSNATHKIQKSKKRGFLLLLLLWKELIWFDVFVSSYSFVWFSK